MVNHNLDVCNGFEHGKFHNLGPAAKLWKTSKESRVKILLTLENRDTTTKVYGDDGGNDGSKCEDESEAVVCGD